MNSGSRQTPCNAESGPEELGPQMRVAPRRRRGCVQARPRRHGDFLCRQYQ